MTKSIFFLCILFTQTSFATKDYWNHPFDGRVNQALEGWHDKTTTTKKTCEAIIDSILLNIFSWKSWDSHDDMVHNTLNPDGPDRKTFFNFVKTNSNLFKSAILKNVMGNAETNIYGHKKITLDLIEQQSNLLFESFFSGNKSRSLIINSIF